MNDLIPRWSFVADGDFAGETAFQELNRLEEGEGEAFSNQARRGAAPRRCEHLGNVGAVG
jgi:hypothetical protein